ncbi:MAG: alpha/beta hydrolase family protein [Promethearchaeia archaeon]
MEFEEGQKQFDGPYEVSEIQLEINGELLRGILYFPPQYVNKPYPIILYFHGFPQLYPLQEFVKKYRYLLDMGYAFLVFDFRGYRISEGVVSIDSQVTDALKVKELVEKMSQKGIFNLEEIHLVAHDFGAYVGLIMCAQVQFFNKVLLIAPILDLKRHVNHEDFEAGLQYLNKFVPGNIKGIDDEKKFIAMTKRELENEDYQIRKLVKHLKLKELKIIGGQEDKLTPPEEINEIFQKSNKKPSIYLIKEMDHEFTSEDDVDTLNREVKEFFSY